MLKDKNDILIDSYLKVLNESAMTSQNFSLELTPRMRDIKFTKGGLAALELLFPGKIRNEKGFLRFLAPSYLETVKKLESTIGRLLF